MVRSDGTDMRHAYFQDKSHREKILKTFKDKSVGLHGSKEASNDFYSLNEELELLKSYGFDVKSYRNHYLHFSYQKTFALLERAGFEYDSTLGFLENIGFRAGTSMPFHPYNIKENRPFNILEVPLIVMDVSLFREANMNLPYSQAKLKLFRLIHKASQTNTHISLSWHNTSYEFIDFPLWGKLYWEAIEYAINKGGLVGDISLLYEN
jgi:hypothetical protein